METKERPPKPHADSAFKQQRLPSFYPQHSAAFLSFALLLIAFAFIPIGVSIVVYSDGIFEMDVRYDDVNSYRFPGLGHYTVPFNGGTEAVGSNCKKVITLTKTIAAPVYIYYRLTGFHQNYRQYQESHYDAQLSGETSASDSYCEPFRYPGDWGSRSGTADGKPYNAFHYSPCGSIAWSMFNDSISLYKVTSTTPIDTTDPSPPGNIDIMCIGSDFTAAGSVSFNPVNKCRKRGIAFDIDRETRFQPPKMDATAWTNAGVPGSSDPYLAEGYYAFEPGHKVPATADEDFMVWARTASMPDFMKLYRVITQDLVAGDYLIDIKEHFDTVSFNGEKHIVLATRTWMGTKNYVLGISLIVMGCISFVAVVAIMALKCTRG